jgi:predicted CXXCH cytochrome family protein
VNPVVYPTIKVRVNFTRSSTASTQTIDAVRVDWQATNTFSAASLTCYNCHNTHFVGRGNSAAAWEETRYSDPYDTNATNNTLTTTDFCIRCHQSVAAANFPGARFASAARLTPYPVAFQSITATFFPGWDKSAFTSVVATVGHNATDGTKALCENCHDPHGSNNARLTAWTSPSGYTKITGTRDNTSTKGSESNLCFNCHGWDNTAAGGYTGATAVTGSANVRLNIAQSMLQSYGHTSTIIAYSDRHSDEETAGDLIGAANRHAECVDCHDPHEARPGINATGTSASSPVLKGVRGVVPAYTGTATWTVPTSWQATELGTGNSYEAYLCLKCHSSYLPGWSAQAPTAPSWGTTTTRETDLGQDFNPNNFSGHNVLGSSWPRSSYTVTTTAWSWPAYALNTTVTGSGWGTSNGQMMCTDCHSNDSGIARGPHGSNIPYSLIGTATTEWYTQTISNWGNTVCNRCHRGVTQSTVHANSNHSGYQCQQCHVRIPHGWRSPKLLRTDSPAAPPLPYANPTMADRLVRVRVGTYPVTGPSNSSAGDCGGVGGCNQHGYTGVSW